MLMKKLKITYNAQEISGIFSGISGTAPLYHCNRGNDHLSLLKKEKKKTCKYFSQTL